MEREIEMKRCIIIGAGVLLMTGFANSTFAADLAARPYTKAPPAPAAVYNWTGCFVGVHAGAALSEDKIRSSGDFSSTGFIGGGQIGCEARRNAGR